MTYLDHLTCGTRRQRGFWKRILLGCLIFLLFTCGFIAVYFWNDLVPNKERVQAEFHELPKPVFYQGQYYPVTAIGEKEGLKLPLALIEQWIDPHILYEDTSDSVIITTKDKVLRLQTSQLDAFVNEKPYKLQFPVEKHNDTVYVPIEPLKQLYSVDIRESDQAGVIMVKQGDTLQWGRYELKEAAPLRTGPSIRYPIVADLKPGEKVIIWKEEEAWYKVQKLNGHTGFISKSDIVLDQVESVPVQKPQDTYVPWKPLGGKLNVTWEHVTTKNPDVTKLPELPGLHVISPTWFSLSDGEGNIKNIADMSYVKWAQSRNLQVWALFSNGFDPDRTTKALSSYDIRMKIIRQLLSYSQLYQLNGINIDFENVHLKDKDNLVQFVREMTPLLHEQGLVVSMDVTPKSNNEKWSMFYDRPALSKVIDYMMLMGYDEYWATSPNSGSVASLPWVEKSVSRLLAEDQIPPSKLVLGVPFYTRVWTEESKDGITKASSVTYSMEGVQKLIKDKNLSPVYLPEAGQNYAEYTEGGKQIRVWIEDEISMKARMELVKKFDLAGVASWRRGFERPQIWKTIADSLDKRP